MPKAGSEFGIDISTQLKDLPWQAIRAWRPVIPANPANKVIPNGLPESKVTFAGRYFNPWAGVRWADGENAGVKTANPDLKYIFPIQGYGDDARKLRVAGKKADGTAEKAAKVRNWGTDDAKGTCKRIMRAIDQKELKFPFFKNVIVYLDVESDTVLSPNYWYGWATAVHSYAAGFFSPFCPGLYCITQHNPKASDSHSPKNEEYHRIPHPNVQDGLTNKPNDLASACHGIFATNPQTDITGFNDTTLAPANQMNDRTAKNFRPDWEHRFDVWMHTVRIIFGLIPWPIFVPVRLWQYSMDVPFKDPATPTVNVDLVEKSPDWELLSRMLELQ